MEELLEHYRSWVEYQRWYLRVPGVQVAVRERGQLRLSVALGSADLGSGSPLTEAHLFRIASQAGLVLVDVGDDHLSRRSSSAAAKNADAVLRISFARFSSAFSRRSALTSSALTEPAPGPAPA